MLVNIIGVIGAGKSTLINKLSNIYTVDIVREPVETNPYLVDFYKDPKKYAMPMQYWLLANRYYAYKDAIRRTLSTGTVQLVDLGFEFDISYAHVQYEMGNISALDFDTYKQLVDKVLFDGFHSSLYIYLDTPLDIAMERIKERSRGCETGIQQEYLEKLDIEHKKRLDQLKANGCKVEIVDYTCFDKGLANVLEALKKNNILSKIV